MICLRCGRCCTQYVVAIVDDASLGPVEGNVKAISGERCHHLVGDVPGEYSCSVHDEPWYPESPCARHTQVESSPDKPCRMGEYIMEKEKANDKHSANGEGSD